MQRSLFRPVLAVVLLAAVAACTPVDARDRSSSSPMPTAGTATFTSERYGYSVVLPDASWTIVQTRGDGWAETAAAFDNEQPGIDFADRMGSSEPTIVFNSQPVPSDLDAPEWLADYDAANKAAFECEVVATETADVDGEEARLNTYLCEDEWRTAEAIVFGEDRVYAIRVSGLNQPESFDPLPLLREWLEGFHFED